MSGNEITGITDYQEKAQVVNRRELYSKRIETLKYLDEMSRSFELLLIFYIQINSKRKVWPDQCSRTTSSIYIIIQTIKVFNNEIASPSCLAHRVISDRYELIRMLSCAKKEALDLNRSITEFSHVCTKVDESISLREGIMNRIVSFKATLQEIDERIRSHYQKMSFIPARS